MFNKGKKEAKKAQKEAKKADELAKRDQKIAEIEAEHERYLAKQAAKKEARETAYKARKAERKASIEENKRAIKEIDAHNKAVLQGVASEIKDIAVKGHQKRLKIVNDAIEEGRERRGELHSDSIRSNMDTSTADELLKFQQLLDQELISEEEFDAKRKQILGL